MPVSNPDERGVFLARQYSDSIAGVPIKKRPFHLARSPSPPPQKRSLPPKDFDVPEKKLSFSKPESYMSDTGGHPASEIAKGESIANRDVNLAPKPENFLGLNHLKLGVDIANSAESGISNLRELILDDKSPLRPPMGSTQLLSVLKEPLERHVGEGSGEGKLVPSDKSAFRRVTGNIELQLPSKRPCGQPRVGQKSDWSFVKQEKLDCSSKDLALAEGQCNLQIKCSDVESKADSVHLMDRRNWDLNTVMDTGEDSGSVINHGTVWHDGQDLGTIKKKRLEPYPVQMLSRDPNGIDVTLNKCMLHKSDYHLKLSNLCSPINEHYNSMACLDLQLKPSDGSELPFRWDSGCPSGDQNSIRGMSDLSLSVKPISSSGNSKLADWAVKSEPYEKGSQKDTRKVETGSPKSVGLGHVKSEPCEGSVLNSVCGRAVKLEMPEDPIKDYLKRTEWKLPRMELHNPTLMQETLRTTGSSNTNAACYRAMKLEPLQTSQQKRMGGKSFQMELNHTLMPHTSEAPHDARDSFSKAVDSFSKPLVSIGCMPHNDFVMEGRSFEMEVYNQNSIPPGAVVPHDAMEDVSKAVDYSFSEPLVSIGTIGHNYSGIPINTKLPEDSSEIVGEVLGLASQPFIPDSNNSHHGAGMTVSPGIPEDVNGIVSDVSDMAPESLIFEGKALSSAKETSEIGGLASDLLLQSIVSDGKESMNADGMSEVVAQIDCSDGDKSNSSKCVSADEFHVDSYGNREVVENDEEGKLDISGEIVEEGSYHNKFQSDSPHNVVVATDSIRKQCRNDDDYEDGEVRDSVLHGAVEDSCEGRGEQVHGKEVADSIGTVDVPTMTPPHADGEENKMEEPNEFKNGHAALECDADPYDNKNDSVIGVATKLHDSSAVGGPTAGSGKKRLIKTTRKVPQDHLGKEKGPETKPKSNKALTARTATKRSQGEASSQQEDASGSDLLPAKHSVLPKTDSSLTVDETKHDPSTGDCSEIVKRNPAPNRFPSGNTKSIPGRLLSSQAERERLDKSLRRDKPHSRVIRVESCNDRFRNSKNERNQDHPYGKKGSDFMRMRGRADNRVGALHVDQNFSPGYGRGHLNSSTGLRFSRPKNVSEVSFVVASDGPIGNAGRVMRKPPIDEPQCSRLQSNRRSSGEREGQIPVGMQMIRRPVRDISIGRAAPDFALLDHEEKFMRAEENFMRAFPDEMVDPQLLRPRSQYERAENTHILRERRSVSPNQRRGPPLHLPHICLKPPSRSRTRSPHQWSPPRRSPDGFEGYPDLTRCRSPPIIRLDRVRSPCQRLCFAEDVAARRHGSPPYISRLPNDMRDISPEHNFLRPRRGLQRNIRRFDSIDPREGAEGEYFESVHFSQFRELAVDDECADDRRKHDERHGLVRSLSQRFNAGDAAADDESFRYGVENDPRSFRFCPEVDEEFPDRGSSRDMDGRIRNRLGNLRNRVREMEEHEQNIRYHGGPGWHDDAGFNNVRLKRRRF